MSNDSAYILIVSMKKEEREERRVDCVSRRGTQEREVLEGRSTDYCDNGEL
jgi:hypothetical protein